MHEKVKTYIKESFKNGVPWYEGKYYMAAFKNQANIGFSVEGLTEEQRNLFQGKGSFMRHIKLYTLADIDEKFLIKLLKVAK